GRLVGPAHRRAARDRGAVGRDHRPPRIPGGARRGPPAGHRGRLAARTPARRRPPHLHAPPRAAPRPGGERLSALVRARARQLAATGRLRVVSEPVVLSQALRLAWPMAVVDGKADLTVPPAVDGADGSGTALVRGVLGALGAAADSPWILKGDTWHVFHAP